ncbi:MAG: VgrG-related protein [Dermatophilaceae bacterium]
MLGEDVSSTLVIELDGALLPHPAAAQLVSATLDESVNAPALFILRFLDEGADVLTKARAKIGGSIKLKVHRSGSTTPIVLLNEGEVTGLQTEITPAGTQTVIRGYDKSHRLTRGLRFRAFRDTAVGEIARKVVTGVGVTYTPGTQRTGPTAPAPPPHLSQPGLTDWDFLQRLAVRTGAAVTTTDGKVSLGPLAEAKPLSGSKEARKNALVLEKGVNLVSLRATLTAGDQVPQVQVRAWDVATKKTIRAAVKAYTGTANLDGATPGRFAADVKASDWIESVPTLPDADSCTTMARSLADRLAGSYAELDGVARGNAALRAGIVVQLVGAGKSFDGTYTLTSTRHEFTKDRGYLTAFTVSNRSDRTAYGLMSGAAGTGRRGRWDGAIVGIVTNIKDPEKRGRVKVTFPVLPDDFESTWARTVQPGAGKQRGAMVLPEVNDEVLVVFGMGDFDEPYVLGGLYNGMDKPVEGSVPDVDSGSGTVQRRAFVSRTGMAIEIIEGQSDATLTVSTNKGDQRITLTQSANKGIEIISEGPLTVTAKKDVKVSSSGGSIEVASSTGDLTLKGTKVTIDAKSDVQVNGVNVKLAAKAQAELSGAMVKVAGQAQAELSASGPTTISGAIVKIN